MIPSIQRILSLSTVLCIAWLFSLSFAHAQEVNSKSTILAKPEHPGPFESVELEATNFTFDINRATIVWYQDGVQIGGGVGAKHMKITTGPLGSATKIDVVLLGSTGQEVTLSRTFRPTEVGIVWEAQTYTPPLYKGKALYTPGAAVTFTAVPVLMRANGALVQPKELVYTWRQNYQVLHEQSGPGRQTVVLKPTTGLRPLSVSVEVTTLDKTLSGTGQITVPVAAPFIGFYEVHPLLGVRYEEAFTSAKPVGVRETTLIAEPYFFSTQVRSHNSLSYTWRLGGKLSDHKQPLLTLVQEGAGNVEVELALRHLGELMQTARATVRVLFTGSQSSNINTAF